MSNIPRALGFKAMGIPLGSMINAEISDAIPPAYSKFVAEAWLRSVRDAVVASASAPGRPFRSSARN